MTRMLKRLAVALGTACAVAASTAHAQDYPNRPIQLLIPYTAGGAGDVFGRLVAEQLSTRLGQRVVPENRPGAGTVLAAGMAAKAAPNGYTLLLSTLAHSINATLQPQLPFDPVKDFDFIGKVGQFGFLVVANPQLKVNDLRGLVELMRNQPSKVTFGSAGVGSPMHLGGELLKHVTKTDATHVPYKGEAAALNDLIGGHVNFMLCTLTTCASRIQDGTIKALAVASPSRSPLAPSVPTNAEAGFPGSEIYTWVFLAAPKGTPAAVMKRLDQALNDVLADEKFKSRALAMGVETDSRTSPAATKAFVQSEIDKWRPIIKASGMTVN